MVDCTVATLSGGVLIGSSSDLVAAPWVSIIIGFFGGILTCINVKYMGGFLERKLGVHDTCGVHTLHGVPGVIGGILGGISAGLASSNVYGDNLNVIFPELSNGRSQLEQSGFQFAALGSSIAISLIGGYLTGMIIRLPFFESPNPEDMFDDEMWWTMSKWDQPLDKRLTKANIK